MTTVSPSQLYRPKGKRNRPVIDGITFDSPGEARRYRELKLLQASGAISDLECHPRFPLVVNGKKIGNGYIKLDFKYVEYRNGLPEDVYEDVKGRGVIDRVSKLRIALCEALHGIKVEIVER